MVLSRAFISMPACTDFEVERTVNLIFLCSMNSGKMLCTTPGTLISSSVHGLITWYKLIATFVNLAQCAHGGSGELLLLVCGALTKQLCNNILALVYVLAILGTAYFYCMLHLDDNYCSVDIIIINCFAKLNNVRHSFPFPCPGGFRHRLPRCGRVPAYLPEQLLLHEE